MKTLQEYISESKKGNKIIDDNTIKDITKWINDNYDVKTLKVFKRNEEFFADAEDVKVKNKDLQSLTNGSFKWNNVEIFTCEDCNILTNLEGAPNDVTVYLYIHNCKNLVSLEGAPEKCGIVGVYKCPKLINLLGAPKVCKEFGIEDCDNLVSLEGAPEAIKTSFVCKHNKKLKSLDFAPENTKNIIYDCGRKWTAEETEKYNLYYKKDNKSDSIKYIDSDEYLK